MIEEKLRHLGISLPIPPKPAGSYIPVVVSGSLVFVSGQIPMEGGQLKYQGKVQNNQSVENAQSAARLCIINALSQLNAHLGTLEHIEKIVRVSGFVNAEENFTEHPKVINAASELLVDVFGQKGKHTRIAVGVSSLPLNATVEIEMIVEISKWALRWYYTNEELSIVMNFLILVFGIDAPHALSCPPPEPPNSVASLFTSLPKCTLQLFDPLTDTA